MHRSIALIRAGPGRGPMAYNLTPGPIVFKYNGPGTAGPLKKIGVFQSFALLPRADGLYPSDIYVVAV